MLPHLVSLFRASSELRTLVSQLPRRKQVCDISGLPGSSAAVLVAALNESHPPRVLLLVAANPTDAEMWYADLNVLIGSGVRLYPQREALGEEEPHFEIAGERVETIDAVLGGSVRVVVTTLAASVELTRMVGAVELARVYLEEGTSLRLSEFVERLESMGYERRPSTLDVAQFAVRGGIVDVYGFGMAAPARIEWWGDEIVSIREFDLDSQRSEGTIDSVTLLPVKPGSSVRPSALPPFRPEGSGGAGQTRKSLLDLLPPDTLIVLPPNVDTNVVKRIWDDAARHLDIARRRGEDVPGREAVFLSPDVWSERWHGFGRLNIVESADVDFGLAQPPEILRDMKRLTKLVKSGPTLILCDNEGQLERLEELLSESNIPGVGIPDNLTLALGSLHGGFVLPGLTVLTDHEIFRRARRVRRLRRYRQATASAVGALSPGDYVVHLEHGIGVYQGIQAIQVGDGATMEVIVLEYEGGARLNVPLYGLDQIEPYRIGADSDGSPPPRIDRLGGARWRKQRAKTERMGVCY